MSKIEKPVKWKDEQFLDMEMEIWNDAIDQSDKYWEQEMKEIKDKYYELILAVGNKYDGETRHQTALKYIRKAESNIGEPSQVKQDKLTALSQERDKEME
jgi:hypothetical protein